MRRPRVALLVETSNAYGRGLMLGIVAYVREHRPWSIQLTEHARGDPPPAWLRRWDGDGLIARIETPAIARAVREMAVPTIDVSAARLVPALPWVETDDVAIARLAARHLLERGLRRLAWCGDERFQWSRWREEAFVEAARAGGAPCERFASSHAAGSPGDLAALTRWLAALPRPVGLMACYDQRARHVLDACREAGLRVPDDVAVVGVDDDEVLCELCEPPLSSVRPDARGAGYHAARLLDAWLAGSPPGPAAVRLPPLALAARRSSQAVAVADDAVAEAARFIRDHVQDGINVKDVLRHVGLTRRALDRRFTAAMGRTPHHGIRDARLVLVKELLRTTSLPLAPIAHRAGFNRVDYLITAFRRDVGMTPAQWRQRAGQAS